MEGLIFDIKRFAVHDGPGIRTTVFFKGCPLNCFWCHNPESRKAEVESYDKEIIVDNKRFCKTEQVGYKISIDKLLMEVLQDEEFYDESNGGVTFSGGEPLLQHAFLLEILKACKAKGIHTAIDTTGYTASDKLKELIPYVDLFLFDIKHMNREAHLNLTGVDNDLIMKNLQLLSDEGKHVIIRFPVVPEWNDSIEDLTAMKQLLAELRIKELNLLPYHKTGRGKYERFNIAEKAKKILEPSAEYVLELKQLLESEKLHVKIGG